LNNVDIGKDHTSEEWYWMARMVELQGQLCEELICNNTQTTGILIAALDSDGVSIHSIKYNMMKAKRHSAVHE
jgi:hypothetical protein